jgi:hypothetical protein
VGVHQSSDAVEGLSPPRFADLATELAAGLSSTDGQSGDSSAETPDGKIILQFHAFDREAAGTTNHSAEDGRLIYHDILCMSWAAVSDRADALGHEPDTDVSDVEIDHGRQG